MPIYAYRCESCGYAKDVLQKMSDPVLSTCPACGAESFKKQLTAAGFQLKGSGWYVTDFRNGSNGGAAKPADAGDKGSAATGGDAPAAATAAPATPAPAAATPSTGSSSAPSSGTA